MYIIYPTPYNNMKNLTTCPVYSCIMLHMLKGRQYSAHTVQAMSMSAPQFQRWSLRPTLDLDTDNFQSQETNSTVPYMHAYSMQLLNIALVAAWHTACVPYIA